MCPGILDKVHLAEELLLVRSVHLAGTMVYVINGMEMQSTLLLTN